MKERVVLSLKAANANVTRSHKTCQDTCFEGDSNKGWLKSRAAQNNSEKCGITGGCYTSKASSSFPNPLALGNPNGGWPL